ncbi:MAG: hypothetical protein ABI382_14150 [Nakamurella sp.]
MGRRQDQLTATAADVFADFADVVLPIDARAARRDAAIVAGRDTVGLQIVGRTR